MRFLVDAQLPPALARLLSALGPIAEHVVDLGLCESNDSTIWSYALKHRMVILTKDEDFRRRLRQSRTSPVIVWLRVGNSSRRALLQWFEPLVPKVVELIEGGERLVEIR